jgi:hypothetical protein
MCDGWQGSLIESEPEHRHESEAEKNCGDLAARLDGVHHGSLSSSSDDCGADYTRGQVLLHGREVLQDGLLRRAQTPFRACCTRLRPGKFPKRVAGCGGIDCFTSDFARAGRE